MNLRRAFPVLPDIAVGLVEIIDDFPVHAESKRS